MLSIGVSQDIGHIVLTVDMGEGKTETIRVFLTKKKQNPPKAWIGIEASSKVKIDQALNNTFFNNNEADGNK